MAKGTTNKPAAQASTALSAALVALLTNINAAGEAGVMLTQEQGLEAVQAGYATVDTSVTQGNTAKVTLTDAGRAALAAATGGNSDEMREDGGTTGTGEKFAIQSGFVVPENAARRGRQSSYPFDRLEVGQFFDVPPETKDGKLETTDEVIARLQSSVSGARARYAEEIPGEFKDHKVREYQKDAEGNFVKDAEGKRILLSERTEKRPATKTTRDFKVIPIPNGVGARVGRIA